MTHDSRLKTHDSHPSTAPLARLGGTTTHRRTLTLNTARLTSGFHALHNRNYRLFWTSQIISFTGNWMQTTAQAWLVLQITGSSLSLGTVTALQFLPITLLSLYGGLLADRMPKRSALLVTQTAAMIQAFIFGTLVATDAIQLWHIYILAAIQGLINAIDNPIRQAFVVEMVGRDELVNAVALNSTAFNSARIIGPSVAGLIIDQIGIAPTLLINAVSYFPILAALLRMDVSLLHLGHAQIHGTAIQRVKEGLVFAWNSPTILPALITVGFLGMFGYNFSLVLPLLARFVLHTGAAGFGSLGSFLGIGSLIAAIMTAYMAQTSMRRMLMGAGAFSIVLGALALSPIYGLSAVLLMALGFAGITFATSSNTQIQLAAPDEMRGRIMSVHFLLFAGSTPIGGFFIGALSDLIGVQATLVICAGMCALGVSLATAYWRRHRQVKEPIPGLAPGR